MPNEPGNPAITVADIRDYRLDVRRDSTGRWRAKVVWPADYETDPATGEFRLKWVDGARIVDRYRSSGRKGRDPVVTRRSRDKAVAVLLARVYDFVTEATVAALDATEPPPQTFEV